MTQAEIVRYGSDRNTSATSGYLETMTKKRRKRRLFLRHKCFVLESRDRNKKLLSATEMRSKEHVFLYTITFSIKN